VAVSVLTTFTTPYMIHLSEPVYKLIEKILPKNWKNTLNSYSVATQNISEITDWKKVLQSFFINVIIFSVIIITIIVLSTQYLVPLFSGYKWNNIITVTVALALLAPFLWALAFRRTERQAYANVWVRAVHRGPLIALLATRILLAIFYIGFLFDRLFSPLIALVGAIVTSIILALFSKKIKAFYGIIEMRFMTNFNEREIAATSISKMLTPWDTHITTFELNEKSPYIGKTLLESRIREEFGVNIAVIQRGDYVINVPGRETHLYPNDKLSVIGTDEQIEKFRLHLESTAKESRRSETELIVSLHHFTIGRKSIILGKNIRESAIRERTKGLVVGVERDGKRILNPESDLVFQLNDKVWIVGNEKRIKILTEELAG
jgi:monovalent cation:H+ antiporter-2, CPA2 family